MGLWTAKGGLPKVTAGTGINPVNSVSYNNTDPGTSPYQPVGALLSVSLGTTTSGQYDSDSFTYDPNTGRPTKYTFSVGNPAQTDVGQLTWNANGSLYQLQTTDNTSGSIDTQTCYYTHDDLGRIASVNCANGPTNVWQQNFSYDPFGNITKTIPQGGIGTPFQVNYDQTTNRINYAGYSYDNNGNLTADATGSHQYSWDAEGRPTCIDNVGQTYDAMGRLVEQARGGSDCAHPGTSYQQVVYGPDSGKLALMTAQTLSKAFVPLPGGATAVYTSTGLAYYRHSDHLGSSRLASTPARTPYFTGAYAPFGESYKEAGSTDRSFTGDNEDTVAGTADFMYREYSSNQQGRWISPDPAGLAAVSMTNPQSWNRYGYVINSPLSLIDPLGLCGDFDSAICVAVWKPFLHDFGGGGGGGPVTHALLEDTGSTGGGGGGGGTDPIIYGRPADPTVVIENNPGYKDRFCRDLSNKAALTTLIPGGEYLFKNEFTAQEAAAGGLEISRELLLHQGLDMAATSSTVLYGAR